MQTADVQKHNIPLMYDFPLLIQQEKELKSYPEYMSGLHGDIFQLPSEDNSAEESNESGDDDYSNTHASASATTSEASSRLPRVIPNRGKMSRHLLHNSCDMYNPGHFIGSLRDIIAMMPKGLKILKVSHFSETQLPLIKCFWIGDSFYSYSQ